MGLRESDDGAGLYGGDENVVEGRFFGFIFRLTITSMTTTGASRRDYIVVTSAYWAFTVTDGALRMLVLLHFHELGFNALQLAALFLLYEFFGIITNLTGGWVGARFGLNRTLFVGLLLQIIALSALALVSPSWVMWLSVAYVMATQAVAGIAKDFTKMSSKSSVKLLVPADAADSQKRLFFLVAVLTGSKNALKGVGFFLGALLLQTVGFAPSLFGFAALLAIVWVTALILLKQDLGKSKTRPKFKAVFSKRAELNFLSAARLFLFASRDIWFVVALPLFMTETLGWSFWQTGAFMAFWVIGYGCVQAITPRFVKTKNRSALSNALVAAIVWGIGLSASAVFLAWGVQSGLSEGWFVLGGVCIFGAIFAMNSSLHSYLILGIAERESISMQVGFYYMANACGRLLGTLLSGAIYLKFGLVGCLWASALAIGCAVAFTAPIRPALQRQQAL